MLALCQVHGDAEQMTETTCGFAWWDGLKSHICRESGEHVKHICDYCGEVHEPSVTLSQSGG